MSKLGKPVSQRQTHSSSRSPLKTNPLIGSSFPSQIAWIRTIFPCSQAATNFSQEVSERPTACLRRKRCGNRCGTNRTRYSKTSKLKKLLDGGLTTQGSFSSVASTMHCKLKRAQGRPAKIWLKIRVYSSWYTVGTIGKRNAT